MTDNNIQRVTYKGQKGYLALYDKKLGVRKLILDNGSVAFLAQKAPIKVLSVTLDDFAAGDEVKVLIDSKWYKGVLKSVGSLRPNIQVEYVGSDNKKHVHTFPKKEYKKHMLFVSKSKGRLKKEKEAHRLNKIEPYSKDQIWKTKDGTMKWSVMQKILQHFHIPESMVEISDEEPSCSLLDDNHNKVPYGVAGIYIPDKKRVRIFAKNIKTEGQDDFPYRVTAHELTHAVWHKHIKELKKYADIHKDELIRSGGVTDYSRNHWDLYHDKPVERRFYLAVNETLAEISAMQQVSFSSMGDSEVPPVWQKFHDLLLERSKI